MRRQLLALIAASSLAGCLGSFGQPPGGGSDPGSSTSTTGGGSTSTGGGSTAGNSNSGGSTSAGNTGAGDTGGTGANTGGSSNTGMSGPPSPTGSISLALASTSQTIRLNETKTFDLTVTPAGGFDGMVQLALDAPPPGLTATFTPAALMMSGTAPATVQVSLAVASDFMPSNTIPLTFKGLSGQISGAVDLTLDVPATLLVAIPNNVDIGTSAQPNLEAFGASSIPTLYVSPGTKITFINNDSINHQIHSDGDLGISHEGGPLMANGANTYTQTFNGTGTFSFRCHIHPNMKGEIVVK